MSVSNVQREYVRRRGEATGRGTDDGRLRLWVQREGGRTIGGRKTRRDVEREEAAYVPGGTCTHVEQNARRDAGPRRVGKRMDVPYASPRPRHAIKSPDV